jgi:hypothetical protein
MLNSNCPDGGRVVRGATTARIAISVPTTQALPTAVPSLSEDDEMYEIEMEGY